MSIWILDNNDNSFVFNKKKKKYCDWKTKTNWEQEKTFMTHTFSSSFGYVCNSSGRILLVVICKTVQQYSTRTVWWWTRQNTRTSFRALTVTQIKLRLFGTVSSAEQSGWVVGEILRWYFLICFVCYEKSLNQLIDWCCFQKALKVII